MGGQGLSGRRPWWLAAAVVGVDQLAKALAVAFLEDGPVQLIGDFLELRLTRNPGAAFSSFTDGGRALAVIAIVVAVAVALAVPRMGRRSEQIALLLILGGAIGNLTDRIVRGGGLLDGAVVDFIDFSFWPTFNIADAAISVGVAVLVLGAFLPPGRRPAAHEGTATSGDDGDHG